MKLPILDVINQFVKKDEYEYVALDLGAGSVKGLYIKENSIRKHFNQKFKDSAAETACQWLGEENLLSKELRLALKGPDTLIRYVPFPKMEKKKLKEVFSYEISKFIPFNREDVYFDIAIIDENYSKKEFLILLAVIKKAQFDSVIKIFSQKNANLSLITLNNIALINLFLNRLAEEEPQKGEKKEAAAENIMILDIGVGSTLCNLIRKDIPCLSREIKISAASFFAQLAKAKNIKPEEAKSALAALIDSGKDAEIKETLKVLEEVILELAEEVKNSLDYFEINWGKPIQQILLTGGVSRLEGITGILEHSLGIETKMSNPFEYTQLSRDDTLKGHEESFAVALGLAV